VSAIDKILDRLMRVKQTGPDKYIAACPCCNSQRTRPVSVRGMEDGRVLVHAFCGCETSDLLKAIGLNFGDLFEKRLANHLPPVRGGIGARELLELNAHEAAVAAELASDAQVRRLTPEETHRLKQAAWRLATVQGLANGH
jgi:hypothetical protein